MGKDKPLFREKSLDRLSSPEQLNEYLHVTSPAIWIVLVSVILLLVSILIWSNFTVIESCAYGTASVQDGVLAITFEDAKTAENVETGMTLTVGGVQSVIESVGMNEKGERIASASAAVPDGTYDVKVGYKYTQIIRMLFN